MSRTVVVGASSGLGRCIGVGLAQRGGQIALLARRRARIEAAAEEADSGAVAIECDVTDEASCRSAFDQAAEVLGGIDNPFGAVFGGIAVGVLGNLIGAYLVGNEVKLSVALAIIIAVLVWRPSGLFGRRLVARV